MHVPARRCGISWIESHPLGSLSRARPGSVYPVSPPTIVRCLSCCYPQFMSNSDIVGKADRAIGRARGVPDFDEARSAVPVRHANT